MLLRISIYLLHVYFFLDLTSYKLQAIAVIGKEEGIQGYWKGNLPQVCTIRKECIGISVFISHNIDQSFHLC